MEFETLSAERFLHPHLGSDRPDRFLHDRSPVSGRITLAGSVEHAIEESRPDRAKRMMHFLVAVRSAPTHCL